MGHKARKKARPPIGGRASFLREGRRENSRSCCLGREAVVTALSECAHKERTRAIHPNRSGLSIDTSKQGFSPVTISAMALPVTGPSVMPIIA